MNSAAVNWEDESSGSGVLKAYSHLSAKYRGSISRPYFLRQAETAGKAAESDGIGIWECELLCAAARGIVSEAWLCPLLHEIQAASL